MEYPVHSLAMGKNEMFAVSCHVELIFDISLFIEVNVLNTGFSCERVSVQQMRKLEVFFTCFIAYTGEFGVLILLSLGSVFVSVFRIPLTGFLSQLLANSHGD